MADPSLHQKFEERLDESLDRHLERIDQAASKAMGTRPTAEIAHEQGREGSTAIKDRFQAEGRPAERAFRALDAGRVDPFEQRAAGTEAANMERSRSPPLTISEAGRQHLADLEALKADPKALLYRLDPEGGFTVGQRESGLASYAYPTSESASHAKGDPATVARDMFEREWRDRDLRAEGAPAADTIREKDARLMESLADGLTDGTTEAAPRFEPSREIDAQLDRLAHPFDGYPDRDTSPDDSPLPDLDPVKAEAFVQEVREEEREAARQEIASLREAMGGPAPEREDTLSLPGVVRKEPEQLALASAVREKPASREFDRW